MNVVEALLAAFATGHPADAAWELESMEDEEAAAALWLGVPPEARSLLLAHMPHPAALRLLTRRSAEEVGAILAGAPGDVAAPVLRALPAARRDDVLATMGEAARTVNRLLAYPEGTAGALMDPLVPAYRRELTVSEALTRGRRDAAHAISYVYVIDSGGALEGVLTVRELLLADPGVPLHAVMKPGPAALPATASWETVLAHPGWQRAHALPVTERGRYVGAVRHRTLRALQDALRPEHGARDRARTSRDLAELYALGWSSLLAWGSSVLESGLRGRGDE